MNKKELMELLITFKKEISNGAYVDGFKYDQVADPNAPLFVAEPWRCGGLTGGSCWGTNADRPVESDPENELTALNQFLEKHFPDLSFLKYRKLAAKIQYSESTVGEYYGNYTEYRTSYIMFEDICEALDAT